MNTSNQWHRDHCIWYITHMHDYPNCSSDHPDRHPYHFHSTMSGTASVLTDIIHNTGPTSIGGSHLDVHELVSTCTHIFHLFLCTWILSGCYSCLPIMADDYYITSSCTYLLYTFHGLGLTIPVSERQPFIRIPLDHADISLLSTKGMNTITLRIILDTTQHIQRS